MPRHHDPPGIDARRCDQIIHGPLQPPRPRSNGSTSVCWINSRKKPMQPALVRRVRIDVAVVGGRQCITAIDHVLYAPNLLPRTTAGFRSAILHDADAPL